MEEQRICLHTAMLAKKKGFNIDTEFFYTTTGDLNYIQYYDCTPNNKTIDDEWFSTVDSENGEYAICTAPTQSLLQKWLREIHNIIIEVKHYDEGEGDGVYFRVIGSEPNTRHEMDIIAPNKDFKKYEDALETGLYEALLLINDDTDR